MSFHVKGLGAEPKWKLALLGGALVVLALVFYFSVLAPSDDAPPAAARADRSAVPAANPDLPASVLRPPATETRQRPPLRPGRESMRQEFKQGLRDKQPDPVSVDPTLRLDLLAKVQAVSMAGGVRNLFQFGAVPLPSTPEKKIVPMGARAAAAAAAAGATPQGPLPTPPPPPIPLKFYGYAAPAPSGAKRVFFLDGEDIIVAAEGQLVKNRYRVVRVGVNSVTVEDVESKHEQTLPLEEQTG
jgi:hypothetical protein